jgi:Nuclease-related domain
VWGSSVPARLGPGAALLFVGAAFWTFEPRAGAAGMLLVGVGGLAFALVAFGFWLWRSVRGTTGRPWGRLLFVGLVIASALHGTAIQRMVDVLPMLNALPWALALLLLVRVCWLATRRPPRAEAAIWAAGAMREDLVAQALAGLNADHVVIHNVPLGGHGDADHVVIGPAGVVVLESRKLAGARPPQCPDIRRLACHSSTPRLLVDKSCCAAALEDQLVRHMGVVPARAHPSATRSLTQTPTGASSPPV